MDSLKHSLWEKSDEGRKGITPEMAQDIVNAIKDQQGSVSPEMTRLLESLQKDGATLSKDTFRQLQDAARKAKGAGLDLGVKPEIEQSLLQDQDETPGLPNVN